VGAHNNAVMVLLDPGIPGPALASWTMIETIGRTLQAWTPDAVPRASFAASGSRQAP
jgi:hypothetical protein